MKTLIVYEKNTGMVSFTQSLNGIDENTEYASMIADIPEDRIVSKVEDGEVVLEDTEEEKERKRNIKELKENLLKIKENLLLEEMGVVLC